MPLLNHFRPPLLGKRPWESFHSAWAVQIATGLNDAVLPEHYLALPKTKLGVPLEADVSTYEVVLGEQESLNGAVATATRVYAPPKPGFVAAVDFTSQDVFEVQVSGEEGNLVAAIELVSLSNKDRSSNVKAFVRKCASYLEAGVSVLVVDIVTSRRGNFHRHLTKILAHKADLRDWQGPYAAAYRTLQRKSKVWLEGWPVVLKFGKPLPTMPLWLASDLAVPLNLELSYAQTCKGLRIPF